MAKARKNRAKQTDDHVVEPEFTVVNDLVFEGGAKKYDPTDRSTSPVFIQCPACYPGLGGLGGRKWWRRVNGELVKRCYQCDRCGHIWTVDIRTKVVVDYMDTDVEYRDPPQMETR